MPLTSPFRMWSLSIDSAGSSSVSAPILLSVILPVDFAENAAPPADAWKAAAFVSFDPHFVLWLQRRFELSPSSGNSILQLSSQLQLQKFNGFCSFLI